MALTYGFYNSLNGDRKYYAEQFSALFDNIITDGVIMGIGKNLFTIPGDRMQVIVQSGRAWFDHTWTLNDSDMPIGIDPSDTIYGRIDAVVLEVDSRDEVRANRIKIVKGTPSSNPQRPVLTNTIEVHEHPLAWVTVEANASAITDSDIEIQVGMGETPFCTSVLQATDIEDLFRKWDGDFQKWFNNVKAQLDGNIAANLQKQIDAINLRLDIMGQSYSVMELYIKLPDGSPLPNTPVTGLIDIYNPVSPVVTDSNGYAIGYINGGEQTYGVGIEYADLETYTITETIPTGQYLERTLVTTGKDSLFITSTCNLIFTSNVEFIDACLVGAGGHGGSYYSNLTSKRASGGSGAGGGAVVNVDGLIPTPYTNYAVIIGAGGNGNGGATSFMDVTAPGGSSGKGYSSNTDVVPTGGAGGTPGGGNGGDATANYLGGNAGKSGSGGYSSRNPSGGYNKTTYGGGGGSGTGTTTAKAGGSGGGGNGGYCKNAGSDYINPTAGAANTGGGGGGAPYDEVDGYPVSNGGANGGSGRVNIFMNLKAS